MNVNGINVNSLATAQQVNFTELIDKVPSVTTEDTTAVKPEGQTDTDGEVVIDENQEQEGTKETTLKDLIMALIEAIKELFGAKKTEDETTVDKADEAGKEDKDFNLTDEQEAYIQLYGDEIKEKIAKERIDYNPKYDMGIYKLSNPEKHQKQQAALQEAMQQVTQDDIEAYVKLHWDELNPNSSYNRLKSIFR